MAFRIRPVFKMVSGFHYPSWNW